jgi:hypothetical protein
MNRKRVVTRYQGQRGPLAVQALIGVSKVLSSDGFGQLRRRRHPTSLRGQLITRYDSIAVAKEGMVWNSLSAPL